MIAAGILAHRRVELLRGDIVEMSPEGPEHYYLSDEASDYLKEVLASKAVVRLDGPVTLADSEPEPDIAIVRPPKAQYRDRHPSPEDIFWIIEFSNSTLARDLKEKRAIYASASIPEYWVVDLQKKTLTLFRTPIGEIYQSQQTLSQGAVTPLAFPDTAISVSRLLGASAP